MTTFQHLPEEIELQARLMLTGEHLVTFIDANYVVGYVEVEKDDNAFEIGGRYFLVIRSSPERREYATVSDISSYDVLPAHRDWKLENLFKPGELIFVGLRRYYAVHPNA